MKSRDALIRLKRFQADERRRRVMQIQAMSAEFARLIAELDRDIAAEERRAGIADPTHFAYPTYARAAAQRRDNVKRSLDDLGSQLRAAEAAHEEAREELAKSEALDQRERPAEARAVSAAAAPQVLRAG
ncbi:MAG: flagellar export protein FliJ [Hyphomicrobiales bacterium]|nr:flagellar export protein FliJ [Hyphomicrobiales bacterium]